MAASKPLGTYGNGVGTVTPLDHKLANAALVVKQSGNLIRSGLFYNGTDTIVAGKANMSYDVAAFTAALSRGATAGAVFLANDGVFNVVTTAAPGSNSRYDVIYVWAREYSLDGVDSNPVIGVIQGTAAASPTVPSLAAFPGAIELARVIVPAGVTATNTGTTITQTAPFTATAGGVVGFRTNTEMNLVTTMPKGTSAVLLSDLSQWVFNGIAWNRSGTTPWMAFAPTLGQASGSFAVGNGTLTALWRYNGEDTEIIFRLLFGSTTTVGAGSYFVTPTNMDSTIPAYSVVGRGTFGLTSGSTLNDGCAFKSGAASNQIQFGAWSTSGPYSALVGITATVPLGGWTTNYYIDMLIRYRTA